MYQPSSYTYGFQPNPIPRPQAYLPPPPQVMPMHYPHPIPTQQNHLYHHQQPPLNGQQHFMQPPCMSMNAPQYTTMPTNNAFYSAPHPALYAHSNPYPFAATPHPPPSPHHNVTHQSPPRRPRPIQTADLHQLPGLIITYDPNVNKYNLAKSIGSSFQKIELKDIALHFDIEKEWRRFKRMDGQEIKDILDEVRAPHGTRNLCRGLLFGAMNRVEAVLASARTLRPSHQQPNPPLPRPLPDTPPLPHAHPPINHNDIRLPLHSITNHHQPTHQIPTKPSFTTNHNHCTAHSNAPSNAPSNAHSKPHKSRNRRRSKKKRRRKRKRSPSSEHSSHSVTPSSSPESTPESTNSREHRAQRRSQEKAARRTKSPAPSPSPAGPQFDDTQIANGKQVRTHYITICVH